MSPKRGANETPCRGSTKALPYNFTATSTVGEGLAPPETFVEMTFKSGADQSFRRVRHLNTRVRRTEHFRPMPLKRGANLFGSVG